MVEDPNASSLAYIEELWERYSADPNSVDERWRKYFRDLENHETFPKNQSPKVAVGLRQIAEQERPGWPNCQACGRDAGMAVLQQRVDELIRNYRVRGHRIAKVDPLDREVWQPPELNLEYYGFLPSDMELEFAVTTLAESGLLPVHDIVNRLKSTYCGSIGAQFMHIDDLKVREWLQTRMESSQNKITLSREAQLRILTRLTDAVIFERFLQKKFVGAKSFSLEGAESLIPLLDLAVEKAGEQGVDEIIMGMPHRGRLNVLANIMGKNPSEIFAEFKDQDATDQLGRGDVKYHKGFHRDWKTSTGRHIHLALLFNPSHLEYVSPVALGRVRAKQDRSGDDNHDQALAILIHGDAAFAGEGIVQETLNLSQLDGYKVGGALHVIVNNQIGFTTGVHQSRSSTYATDVAKMLQVPIFHVNGESPEAVAQALDVAMDFRKEFKRDVVIDMYCYRRRGHNEGDEPTFTQPIMYKEIKRRKDVRQGYLEHLLEMGGVTREESEIISEDRREYLEQELAKSGDDADDIGITPGRPSVLGHLWKQYRAGSDIAVPEAQTGLPKHKLVDLLQKLTTLPGGFQPHAKIKRFLSARREMSEGKRALDWGTAEALGIASLADEGMRVRLSGQDSERGTFSHRHAVLHDVAKGLLYNPFNHLTQDQALVDICNSPLSEGSVLGFEFGYSLACPDGLVMWEAQFGDFANAAQVIIDQFIASAEEKWNHFSGLVLLLPHGLEGTGPEHASARLERFLMMAAEDNMQVVSPTTPAQFFHLLRRQVHRAYRKPLIVMAPKSMLRHPEAVSSLDELTSGHFQRILPDVRDDDSKTERVLLCNGKVYYDLLAERKRRRREDVAIVRMEQLYPLQPQVLIDHLSQYDDGTPVVWIQEEPDNMGAKTHIWMGYGDAIRRRWPLHCASRPESATPATGSAASHKLEQKVLMSAAFGRLE